LKALNDKLGTSAATRESADVSVDDDHRKAWAGVAEDKNLQQAASSAIALAPILFAQIQDKRVTATTSALSQTDVYVALRLPIVTDGWSLFAEGGYKWADVTHHLASVNDSAPLGVGGDLRLADGTWLGLYAGADVINGAILSLGNIKWSIGQNAPW